jgi:hypothetical protein
MTLNCVPHQVPPRRRRWTLAGMPSKHTVPPGHSPPGSRILSSISCSASGRSQAKRDLEGVVAAAAWRRLRRRACSRSSSRPPRRCVREGDLGTFGHLRRGAVPGTLGTWAAALGVRLIGSQQPREERRTHATMLPRRPSGGPRPNEAWPTCTTIRLPLSRA